MMLSCTIRIWFLIFLTAFGLGACTFPVSALFDYVWMFPAETDDVLISAYLYPLDRYHCGRMLQNRSAVVATVQSPRSALRGYAKRGNVLSLPIRSSAFKAGRISALGSYSTCIKGTSLWGLRRYRDAEMRKRQGHGDVNAQYRSGP